MSYNRNYGDRLEGGPYGRSGNSRDIHPDRSQQDRSEWSGRPYSGRYNGSGQRNSSGPSRQQEDYQMNNYRRRDYVPSNSSENIRGPQDRGYNNRGKPNKWRRNGAPQFDQYNSRQKRRPSNSDQHKSYLNSQRVDSYQDYRNERPAIVRSSSSSYHQDKTRESKESTDSQEFSRDSRSWRESTDNNASREIKEKEGNSHLRNVSGPSEAQADQTNSKPRSGALNYEQGKKGAPALPSLSVRPESKESSTSKPESSKPIPDTTTNLENKLVIVARENSLTEKEHKDPPEIHIFTLSVAGSPGVLQNDLDYEENSDAETVISDSMPSSEIRSVYRPRGRDPHRKSLKRRAIFSSDEEDEANKDLPLMHRANPTNDEQPMISQKKNEVKGVEKALLHHSNAKSYKIKRDSTGRSQLQRACKRGDLSEVTALVAAGASPNECDFGGFTCLHEAALAGHAEIVSFLIESGADVNKQAHEVGDLETPLMDACENKHYETIEILLKHGADPHICNVDGFSTITKLQHLDASDNSYKRVLKLLDSYISLNHEMQKDKGRSMSIVEDPSEPYFGDLMKKKFDNVYRYAAQGHKEWTAQNFITHALDLQKMPDILFLAARNGHIELVDILLGLNPNPFDINQKNKIGCTVLQATVGRGFYEVVKFLLSRGADPSLKRDSDGRNAYDIATTSALCDPKEASLLEFIMKNPSATVDSYSEETEKSVNKGEGKEMEMNGSKKAEFIESFGNSKVEKVDLEKFEDEKQGKQNFEAIAKEATKPFEKVTKMHEEPVKCDSSDKDKSFKLSEAQKPQQKEETPVKEPSIVQQDCTKQEPESEIEEYSVKESLSASSRKRSFLEVQEVSDDTTASLVTLNAHHTLHSHDTEQPEIISKEQEELKLKAAEEAKVWQEKMLAKKRARKEMFLQAEKEKERQRREDEKRRIAELKAQEERRKSELLQQALEAERQALLAQQKQAALELKLVLLRYPIGLQDAFFGSNMTPSQVLRFAPLYIFRFGNDEWVIDLQIALLLSHSVTHVHNHVTECREELNGDTKDKLWALFFSMIGVGKSGLVEKNGREKFRDLSIHYVKLKAARDLIRAEDPQVFRLIWEEERATKVNLSMLDGLRAPAGSKLRTISDETVLGFVPPKLKKRQDVVRTIHTASSSLW